MEVTMLQIEAHLNQHPANTLEEQVILEGKLAALKTAVYYHRTLTPEVGIQAANTALANLSNSYYFYRTTAYFHGGGFLIMLGDLKKASDFLNEALTMSNQLSNPAARNLTIGNLGLLEFIAGNLNIAQDYFTELYNASRPTINRYGNIYANALTGLAAIYFEWNQLNTAFQYIKEGLHMAEQEGFLDRTLFCYQNYVYFLIACHKYKNANKILQQAKQYANHYNAPRFFTNRIEALSAQLYLYSGHLPQAIIWADTFAAEHEKQPIFLIESEHLLLARIRIAQQQYQEAITLLIQLLKLAEQQTRNRSVIVIKILLAKAYALTGDNMQAVAHLQHALNLAQPERYIRSFVDEGKPIQTLLQQMKTNNLQEESASYIQTVLHSFDPIHEQPTWQASSKNVNTVHLTKRELEVLTHLAQGSTYGESAIALTISKNTLSHHIKNIYRKLKVNNRLQAVSKAQKLNILPE
jgi:LuxR family maltose regulon positive regulatory protein